jgi:uroporphyrinogen-III synthase
MTTGSSDLPRRWAVVTRPEPQALAWCEQLAALGVQARALPLMAIAPAPDREALARWFATLAEGPPRAASLVMFVSPNAAQCFVDALPAGWQWPAGLLAGATGPGTVAVLAASRVPPALIISPGADAAQFDSEHLWAQLRGRAAWAGGRVGIVRGDGGRDWLADRLRDAGAEVEFVQAYARRPPEWTELQRRVLADAQAQPQAVAWLMSSSEATDHLVALVPGADWTGALALASHPRIAEAARRLGFGRVIDIRPTPQAVADALRAHPPT